MRALVRKLFRNEEQATKTIAWTASIAAIVLFIVIAGALAALR